MQNQVQWPDGLCRDLAIIAEEAVESLALPFTFEIDDFDPYFFAILHTPDGFFALRRRIHQPARGFVLLSMENTEPLVEQLYRFLRFVDLGDHVVTWRRSDKGI